MTEGEIAGAATAVLVDDAAHSVGRADWLIDNAQAYGRLLDSFRGARRSVRIAQLAFDDDCAAYANGSLAPSPSRDAVIAERLIDLATNAGLEIQILLNATWILNTARPLRKFFARRGVAPDRIQVRGMSRFPHFMHAKLVLVDEREAFLLGSPFVNSYWDSGGHAPYDARRPLRELGGRPLHDVSMHLRGPVVGDLEAMYASVWRACGTSVFGSRVPSRREPRKSIGAARATTQAAPASAMRVVCDAPNGILPNEPDRAMNMLGELLAGIARASSFIYIEHQYLTSRPIAAAIAAAVHRVPSLEVIIVLNQNPDLTAYRAWQNVQLEEHALLTHPRVGVFSLWSTDEDPERPGVTRINQLFIHSKVIIVDDEWAAVGTSNLDGVSMGDYGDDFAGALGKRIFRGVRNVEVNVVIDARDAAEPGGERDARATERRSIMELRERLWHEHLGVPRALLRQRRERGWLATWRHAAGDNVRTLSGEDQSAISATSGDRIARRMVGRVLPYSVRAFPSEQLDDVGIQLDAGELRLCYTPTWFGVHASPHWIRNIF
jgi:phosphatidylserine/phosphatidylglycerophosphate/cardiolipin synthase-like enzyme